MREILLLMALLFAAYLFLPSTWFSKNVAAEKLEVIRVQPTKSVVIIPEDSVLRRHFLTEMRSQIETEYSPRPTDFTLQRHYDATVSAELESRLAKFEA